MLYQMLQRLHGSKSFDDAVNRVLNDAVALHGAEYGNIQLCLGTDLVMVSVLGLPFEFIDRFGHVRPGDGSVSGRVLNVRKSVAISDVQDDVEYAPFLDAAELAGYRGIQCTPMIASDGEMHGLISTLFVNPHEPTRIEMETLQTYAQEAADYFECLLHGRQIDEEAERMRAQLLGLAPHPRAVDITNRAHRASAARQKPVQPHCVS